MGSKAGKRDWLTLQFEWGHRSELFKAYARASWANSVSGGYRNAGIVIDVGRGESNSDVAFQLERLAELFRNQLPTIQGWINLPDGQIDLRESRRNLSLILTEMRTTPQTIRPEQIKAQRSDMK